MFRLDEFLRLVSVSTFVELVEVRVRGWGHVVSAGGFTKDLPADLSDRTGMQVKRCGKNSLGVFIR